METKNIEKVDVLNTTKKMTLGNDVIELKALKEIKGHDDSFPYEAILFVNGKKTANVWNDGWGGETNVEPCDGLAVLVLGVLNDEAKKVKMRQHNEFTYGSIGEICDDLAFNHLLLKDAKKKGLSEKYDLIYFNEKEGKIKTFKPKVSIPSYEEECPEALWCTLRWRLRC